MAPRQLTLEQLRRIETWLVNDNCMTRKSLDEVIQSTQVEGRALLDLLVRKGYLTTRKLAACLAAVLGLDPVASVPNFPNICWIDDVPVKLLYDRIVVPIFKAADTLYLAMADPLDQDTIDEIASLLSLRVIPVVASEVEIMDLLGKRPRLESPEDSHYPEGPLARPEELGKPPRSLVFNLDPGSHDADDPMIRLVDLFLSQALHNLSDVRKPLEIFLMPEGRSFKVKYRIGGKWMVAMEPPISAYMPVLARLQFMTGSPCPLNGPVAEREFKVISGGKSTPLFFSTSDLDGRITVTIRNAPARQT